MADIIVRKEYYGGKVVEVKLHQNADGSYSEQMYAPEGGVTHIYGEVPAGDIDGANGIFEFDNTIAAGTLRLFKNGQRENPDDYSVAGAIATYDAGKEPAEGSVLFGDYDY